jgi:hypothetical protein
MVYLGYAGEAETLYLKARDLNPLHPDAYFPHGSFIYFELGDDKKSVELGEKVSDLSVWTDFAAFLAAAYYNLGELDKMNSCWLKYKEIFERNIEKGSKANDQEALEWQIRVNPYKVSTRMHSFWDYMGATSLKSQVRTAEPQQDGSPSFLNKNDMWELCFQGKTVLLRDVKGFHDLSRLLAIPEKEIHCAELMGSALFDPGGMETIDQKAKTSYRNRVLRLQEEIREAEETSDSLSVIALREEYEQLLDHLASSMGMSGKPRKAGSTVEKARSAVTWRIRSAIEKINREHPALGKHLANSVKTGTFCCYKPEILLEWQV